MRHYSIAFVGLGSIGKRHFKNVCELIESQGDSYDIDLYRSDLSRELPSDILPKVAKQFLYADEISSDKLYDAVFVTNPTSMHYEAVRKFAKHAKSFFIEKPVSDSTEVDESLFDAINNIPSYVACPLRYNPVLQYVKENINYKDAIAVRAISSSYLPDWRPGQDYRECYSAHRNMGGGVGIDLIHEWDYLNHFYGMPKRIFSIQDQISSLEIDSDDIAIYIAKTDTTTIELHLDYFGRKTLRAMDIFLPEDTIHCDIANGIVEYLKEGKTIQLNTERNAFQMVEIKHFFDIINGMIPNDSDVQHAYQVLKLTKGIF